MKKYGIILILFMTGLMIFLYPQVSRMINDYFFASSVSALYETFDKMPEHDRTQERELVDHYNRQLATNNTGFIDPFFTDTEDATSGESTAELNDNNAYADWDYNPETGADDDDSQREEWLDSHGLSSGMFASIEIPKLSLKMPIYLGASRPVLAKGVGQVEGSSFPGGGPNTHTVLAGHRGMATKEMFKNLDRLRTGDVFHIYTSDGKLSYRVYDTNVILPHETSALNIQRGKDLATLLTCHPYRSNEYRLLVHGERIE
ncbi:class C sortase [Salisediminibacterium beveridgei]|uniref:Sortase A, LPXTG specific n=1 Tax=Salisediminibacterium beveridgei TaxID=632773 RepID=A0A1D7QXX0_9BACI|nr:class C sortase [Salisediminibacterium beveridgei]AOM83852.1 Sortase A, LPXTG specific [Salisediminibacterium beveridgei]